jgi:hypothetical protein
MRFAKEMSRYNALSLDLKTAVNWAAHKIMEATTSGWLKPVYVGVKKNREDLRALQEHIAEHGNHKMLLEQQAQEAKGIEVPMEDVEKSSGVTFEGGGVTTPPYITTPYLDSARGRAQGTPVRRGREK